jgi:transketolase C-terminal domain/subunit
MKEVVSKPFAHSLKSHGSVNEKLVVVTNDLTASCEADLFAQAFPDRHISAGIAEQAIITQVFHVTGVLRHTTIPFMQIGVQLLQLIQMGLLIMVLLNIFFVDQVSILQFIIITFYL